MLHCFQLCMDVGPIPLLIDSTVFLLAFMLVTWSRFRHAQSFLTIHAFYTLHSLLYLHSPTANHSIAVVMSDRYWSLYILLKHLCEVVVLTLELIISTAIKSYDSRAQPVLHTNNTSTGNAMHSNGVGSSLGSVGGSANTYTGTGGTSGNISTHQVNTSTLPTRSRPHYTPISTYQPGTMSSNTITTINVPLVSLVDSTTTYGTSGVGGGAGGGRSSLGRGGDEYGVEMSTERTPMLHQYDASGNNEV